MSNFDARAALQSELFKNAMVDLDLDLQQQVVFASLSLDSAYIQSTLSLMCLVGQMRLDEKKFPPEDPATEKEQLALDSMYKIIYDQYRNKDSQIH